MCDTLKPVPIVAVTDERLPAESRQMLLVMYKDYLRGAKGYYDESEESYTTFRFEDLLKKGTFDVPSVYFMLLDTDPHVSIHEFTLLVYFSYLVHLSKSHIVKMDPKVAMKRLGYRKTQLQQVIQNLLDHEVGLLQLGERNNQFIVSQHDPAMIQRIEELTKKAMELVEIDVDPSQPVEEDAFAMPQRFTLNATKQGLSYREGSISVLLARYAGEGKPFEEIVEMLGERDFGDQPITQFEVLRLLARAKERNLFHVIKNKQNYRIEWLPAAYAEEQG